MAVKHVCLCLYDNYFDVIEQLLLVDILSEGVNNCFFCAVT